MVKNTVTYINKGNESLLLLLPIEIALHLGIENKDRLEYSIENGKLVIIKSERLEKDSSTEAEGD